MDYLIAIVGPTATGKSHLAIRLAQDFNGEIVSADSRQIYHHMDIGTAKPDRREKSLIRHHLVDIIDLDEDFSLAQYQHLAYSAIEDIQRRGRLPLLVGGSGLYIRAVLEGWQIPHVPPDREFRSSLEEKAAAGGAGELYRELTEVDPVAAGKIDRRNVRRLIRALEVSRQADTPFSRLRDREPPPFKIMVIGLTADRSELYRRIDSRVDHMIEQGLVGEVKRLVEVGYDFSLPAMSGIGYRQIGLYLRGELSLADAIQQTKFETHRFVRHQYGWFRLKDDRIHWFDITKDNEAEIKGLVAGFVTG
ncbi:MAG: tRNA (adenosine(37)-N6)-dimethylallyltransferase MiaA [Dehalococcoidales bacterium]|nr:tRNA (adenosine(37)-N6)-dimethylallyltransferase MiaA [Dehalococcoidales bacterium]